MINKHLVEGATLPIKQFTYICLLVTIAVWSLACLGTVIAEIVFYNAELVTCLCAYNVTPLPLPPPPCCCFHTKKMKIKVEFYQNSLGEIKWVDEKHILPLTMSGKTVPKGIWTPIATKCLPKNWQTFDDKTMRNIALTRSVDE